MNACEKARKLYPLALILIQCKSRVTGTEGRTLRELEPAGLKVGLARDRCVGVDDLRNTMASLYRSTTPRDQSEPCLLGPLKASPATSFSIRSQSSSSLRSTGTGVRTSLRDSGSTNRSKAGTPDFSRRLRAVGFVEGAESGAQVAAGVFIGTFRWRLGQ